MLVALRAEAVRWLTDQEIIQWAPGEIGLAE